MRAITANKIPETKPGWETSSSKAGAGVVAAAIALELWAEVYFDSLQSW